MEGAKLLRSCPRRTTFMRASTTTERNTCLAMMAISPRCRFGSFSRAIRPTVAGELPAGSHVVEIGCAGGIDWFGRRYRMIGLDLSEDRSADRCAALRTSRFSATRPACRWQAQRRWGHQLVLVRAPLLRRQSRISAREPSRAEARRQGRLLLRHHDGQPGHQRRTGEHRPDLYQTLFLDGDGHVGYETVDANRQHFTQAGLRDRE